MATPSLVLYEITSQSLTRNASGGTSTATHVVPAGEVWVARIVGHRHQSAPTVSPSSWSGANTFTTSISNGSETQTCSISSYNFNGQGNSSVIIAIYPGAAATTFSDGRWVHNTDGQDVSVRSVGGQTITVSVSNPSGSAALVFGRVSYVLEKYRSSI